jgi:hypothetical protein
VEDALAGVIEKPQLDALRHALDDFDFDAALSNLAGIARECGVSKE